jgi:hypothetical protein
LTHLRVLVALLRRRRRPRLEVGGRQAAKFVLQQQQELHRGGDQRLQGRLRRQGVQMVQKRAGPLGDISGGDRHHRGNKLTSGSHA